MIQSLLYYRNMLQLQKAVVDAVLLLIHNNQAMWIKTMNT